MIPDELAARLGDAEARQRLGDAAPPALSETRALTWGEPLSALDSRLLVGAAIAVVRPLLAEWREKRPGDKQPLRAVDGAERVLASPTDDLRAHARAIAKACTRSRKNSLGFEHRIADAARAVAVAAASKPGSKLRLTSAIDALASTEEHRLATFAVAGVYGKEAEVRGDILSVMRTILLGRGE